MIEKKKVLEKKEFIKELENYGINCGIFILWKLSIY